MQIEVIKKPKSIVVVKGSLSVEEFNARIQHVTRRFVEEAELPGFRKGKAPEKMVIEKIGEGALLEEAANDALRATYPTILKERAIEAIGRPQIRITKLARGNPLEFEAETATLPEISLSDYKNIAKTINAKPKEKVVVSDEELEKSLDWLRKSRSKKADPPPPEEGAPQDSEKELEHPPADEQLPELTDEFAQSIGAYKTVEELKNAIRENMKFDKEQKDKIAAELKNGIERMGMQWDTYLTHIKKKEEELRTEWQEDAQKRVRNALALKEIAKPESIEPSDDELNAWAYQYMAQMDEAEKKGLDIERVKDYAYGVIQNQKVLEYLESIK